MVSSRVHKIQKLDNSIPGTAEAGANAKMAGMGSKWDEISMVPFRDGDFVSSLPMISISCCDGPREPREHLGDTQFFE